MGFWQRLGRAIRETLSPGPSHTQSQSEEYANTEYREYESRRHEFPPDLPNDRFKYGDGPYPDSWTQSQKDFWDQNPMHVHWIYENDDWEKTQDAFYEGWLASGISPAEHQEARDRYYDITGTSARDFDWESYREYLEGFDTGKV